MDSSQFLKAEGLQGNLAEHATSLECTQGTYLP